jgi:hypothetical protein
MKFPKSGRRIVYFWPICAIGRTGAGSTRPKYEPALGRAHSGI